MPTMPTTLQLIQQYLGKYGIKLKVETFKTLHLMSPTTIYPPVTFLTLPKETTAIRVHVDTDNNTLVAIHHHHNGTSHIHSFDLSDPKSLQKMLTKLQNMDKKYK